MSDPYVYPGTRILINKFDIRDQEALNTIERTLVTQRIEEGIPAGRFDAQHLSDIHGHLFQDVYPWAGEFRTVSLTKGGDVFLPPDRIEVGLSDVHRRLEQRDYLQGLGREDFANQAAEIIGDINYAHPFREGNGRTQMQYLRDLSHQAGHPIDISLTAREDWIAASRASHEGDYRPMAIEIAAMTEDRQQELFIEPPEQEP